LSEVDIIVTPWTIAWTSTAGSQELAAALAQSQARKLLLPVQPKGWEWVGVEPWQQDDLIRQTVQSLRRIIRGQSLESGLRSNLAALVVAVIAGLILFGIALLTVADLFF
jgi:hypothetical protein